MHGLPPLAATPAGRAPPTPFIPDRPSTVLRDPPAHPPISSAYNAVSLAHPSLSLSTLPALSLSPSPAHVRSPLPPGAFHGEMTALVHFLGSHADIAWFLDLSPLLSSCLRLSPFMSAPRRVVGLLPFTLLLHVAAGFPGCRYVGGRWLNAFLSMWAAAGHLVSPQAVATVAVFMSPYMALALLRLELSRLVWVAVAELLLDCFPYNWQGNWQLQRPRPRRLSRRVLVPFHEREKHERSGGYCLLPPQHPFASRPLQTCTTP